VAETKNAPAKGNQTEGEYFPVLTRGRAGMLDMFAKQREELIRVASPLVRQDFDTWTARALLDVMSRDELLPLTQTRKGLYSIYQALSECAVMGVQFGGHYPQAYLMPEGDTAELDITWEGMAFIAAHGPGAVLVKAPMLVRVFEKDTFRIDQGAGTVVHEYDPRFPDARGKLTGWYMKLEYRDGSVEIPFVTHAKVQEINARYSKKETRSGKTMPAWAKSPEEMEDKTAAKQLLKKPAKMSEGLAMALSSDRAPVEPETPSADVRDRVGARLGHASEALRESAVPVEAALASKPAPEPEPEKPTTTKTADKAEDGKKELF
jgi:recombinational DNA repair protein RecT